MQNNLNCNYAAETMSYFLKLIDNSESLNGGNHDRDVVWISDLN